jgi:hypothetical protein
MAVRWICIAVIYIGLVARAEAEVHFATARRASCTVVRYYVAKYTASAAEAWARSRGATEAEIEAARRCLKDAPAQTAQVDHSMAPITMQYR